MRFVRSKFGCRFVARGEGGFTIVEVLVAVVILVLVLGGVVWLVSSSGKAQQRSDIRQKMAASADSLVELVRANKDWLENDPKCKVEACVPTPLDKYSYKAKSSSDPEFVSEIVITPVDSEADNVGAGSGLGNEGADVDHVSPDLYRISVRLSLGEAEQVRWGKQQPYDLVSSVDSTQLGKGTGSLTVQVCVAANQVDERMAVAGCKDRAQQLEMRYQPPCAADETLSPFELERRVISGVTLPLSCNAAIAESKDIKLPGFAPGSVEVEPVEKLNFKVVPQFVGGSARSPEVADSTSGDRSSWAFAGMAPGDYEIELPPLGGLELWKSHTVPEKLRVSVQNNQEAKAMILLRPVQGSVNSHYEVFFGRNVYTYQLVTIDDWMVNFTPDPVHDAMIQTTTRYRYLRIIPMPGGFITPRTGPSWNGYIAMEPKPFDRYRQAGMRTGRQYVKKVIWNSEVVDNPLDAAIVFNAAPPNLTPMPTGLYSRPEQLSVNQDGFFGQLDKMQVFRGAYTAINKIYDLEGVPLPIFQMHLGEGFMIPTGLPFSGIVSNLNAIAQGKKNPVGVPYGNNYVWLDPLGQPNSSMLYYDFADGECYISSAVPEVPMAPQLLGGGEKPDTGFPGQDRCERDFIVNGVRISNMVPDRSGLNGKTVLWRTNMTQTCIPVDQCFMPDIDRSSIPNPGTIVSNESGFLPKPVRTDTTVLVRPSDEQIARQALGLGVAPPPSIMPAMSIPLPLGLLMGSIPKPKSEEDEQAEKACEQYNKSVEAAKNAASKLGMKAPQMKEGGEFPELDCDNSCPLSQGVNNPFSDPKFDPKTAGGVRVDGQFVSVTKLTKFGAKNDPTKKMMDQMCNLSLQLPPQPEFNPPIAPFVEPPVWTGQLPENLVPIPTGALGGGIPIPGTIFQGGLVSANGRLGIPSGDNEGLLAPSSTSGNGVCFVSGSKVLMEDGSYKPISSMSIKDLVKIGSSMLINGNSAERKEKCFTQMAGNDKKDP